MKMKLMVLSKLLSSTNMFLLSGYILFSLSTLSFLFLASFEYKNICILSSLFICIMHHYVSFRVKFDAELLAHLSAQIHENHVEISLKSLTKQLDQSLVDLGLMNKSKMGRIWTLRFKGCLKLFKIQIALLILQCVLFITLIML